MCTDGTIDTYTNTETLDQIHDGIVWIIIHDHFSLIRDHFIIRDRFLTLSGMPIDIYAVKEFNQDMIDALTEQNFSQDDLDTVSVFI